MKKLIYIFLFFAVNLSAQPTPWHADSFDVIYEHNFDSNTEGPYLLSEWNNDWFVVSGYGVSNDMDWTTIYNHNGNKAVRMDFPRWSSDLWVSYAYGDHTTGYPSPYLPGGIDPDNEFYSGNKGTQGEKWYSYFDAAHTKYDEVYMSYDVMFKPGFEFCLSGKIGGINGFPYFTDGNSTEGFRSSIQWKGPGQEHDKPQYEGGTLGQYIYHHFDPDRPVPYNTKTISWTTPDPYSSEQYFKINPTEEKWIHITQRVSINTPVSTPNGRSEIFINGRLHYSLGQLLLREQASVSINIVKIYTQFGGDLRTHHAIRDEWVMFDNIKVWRYADGVVGVRRGNTASQDETELHLPLSWSNTTATWDDDTPVISAIPPQSVDEGTDFTTVNLDNYVSDPTPQADNLMSWSYTNLDDDSISVDITDRVATMTYIHNETYSWTGTESIRFKVEDPEGNGDSIITTFTVVDTVNVSLPDYQESLINLFRYDVTQPVSVLNGENWNHFNGETDNDVDESHPIYSTEGYNTGLSFNVDSITSGEFYSHSTGYSGGTLYNDSCEATHWRVDGTGTIGYLSINGLTVDNVYKLKAYCSALWASGNTEVTFLDTAKTATVPDNITLLEWHWTADDTVEVLSMEALTDYGYLNVIEINEWYDDIDPTVDTITLADTIQAEWACDLSDNCIADLDTIWGQEVVISTPDTAWFKICNVDFGDGGWTQVGFNTSIELSSTGMGLKLDSTTADSIAYTVLEIGGYITNYTDLFEDITGVHDVFIQAYNNPSSCDYIVFSQADPSSGTTVRHNGKISKWFGDLLKQ